MDLTWAVVSKIGRYTKMAYTTGCLWPEFSTSHLFFRRVIARSYLPSLWSSAEQNTGFGLANVKGRILELLHAGNENEQSSGHFSDLLALGPRPRKHTIWIMAPRKGQLYVSLVDRPVCHSMAGAKVALINFFHPVLLPRRSSFDYANNSGPW